MKPYDETFMRYLTTSYPMLLILIDDKTNLQKISNSFVALKCSN